MPSSASAKKQSRDEEILDCVFHALSDRTRRAMLKRLTSGPAVVSELAGPFDMSRPAISKHLRVLEQARLVRRDVDGRLHRCSLRAEALREPMRWLDGYRGFWDETLKALAAYTENGKQRTAIKRRQ